MPNPGAFQGSCKDFLVSKKSDFARSVTFGYSTELLSTIQHQYFKRYPINLPHNKEPSAEHLAAVDDDAPDPDIEEPDEKAIDAEEYQQAMAGITERKLLVTKRRAQIKRWFIYQYMKDHDGDPRDQHARSLYQAYLAMIRGSARDKPRRKSAINVWHKFHCEHIDSLSKSTAEQENIGKSGMTSLRDKIAHDLFEALPVDEQREWTNISVEEHKQTVEKWEQDRNRPVSTDPVDRQLAIQGIVRFVQPVLDVIADSTGWKVSLFAGGPEPAQEGMLNVISIHSGTTSGDIKLSFGQAERASIKKDFIPSFGAFLRKCYTPEECRARALSDMEGFVPISDMELEGGDAMVHSLEEVGDTATTTASAETEQAPGVNAQVTGQSAGAPSQTVASRNSKASRQVVVSQRAASPTSVSVEHHGDSNIVKLTASNILPTQVQVKANTGSLPAVGPVNANLVTPSVQPNMSTLPSSAPSQSSPPPVQSVPVPSSASALVQPPFSPVGSNTDDTDDEDHPFAITYRLRSETPPSLGCLLPSPSQSRCASPAPSAPPSPSAAGSGIPSAKTNRGGLPATHAEEDTPSAVSHRLSPSPPSFNCLLPSASQSVRSPAPSLPLSPVMTGSALPPLAQSSAVRSEPPALPPSVPPTLPASEPIPSANTSTSNSPPSTASGQIGSARDEGSANGARQERVQTTIPRGDDVRRPRREVKKTAKAISLEEEMSRKSLRGKKRALEVAATPENVTVSKRSRGAPKKKGNRA